MIMIGCKILVLPVKNISATRKSNIECLFVRLSFAHNPKKLRWACNNIFLHTQAVLDSVINAIYFWNNIIIL